MTMFEVLDAIAASDPDGKPTEPTDEDRDRFRSWVIRTHGRSVWDAYVSLNWRQ